MEKIKLFLPVAIVFVIMISCSEDNPVPQRPAVTAPAGDLSVGAEGTISLVFTFQSPGGFKSGAVTATGGFADIESEPEAGASSGEITVAFMAGGTPGAGSVKLTITDNEDQADDATAAITILETQEYVSGLINGNTTWTNDKIWILDGRVIVNTGITLTIEPGTIIKGEEGEGSLAAVLIVAMGGKIQASGTEEAPIIFTSIKDNIKLGETAGTNLSTADFGFWGGLVILGKAPISAEAVPAQIEGIPADDTFGQYGGSEAGDNSGTLTYISIRHGGALIGEGNEINGLTLGGVGSGTTISHVEVVANLDDGIEFFGGTVNVTNTLVWAQGDDAYDVDQAYSGTVDNFVYIAGNDSDHAFEIDGPEGSEGGKFIMKNGTLKGATPNGGEFADFRDGAEGTLMDCYFFNFRDEADIELDDDVTSANYFAGNLVLTGLEFNASGKIITDLVFDKAANGDNTGFQTQMTQDNNVVTTPSVGADTSVFGWTLASDEGALDF